MDLFLASLLFLVLFCASLYYFLLSRPNNDFKLPPGKTGLPFIGETLQFVSWSRKGNPYMFFKERMSKYNSPEIFKTSLAGQRVAVFCGPQGNKFLFSSENRLVKLWLPPSIAKIIMSAGASSIMRGIIPEFLRPDALQRYIPIMDSMTREHLKAEWTGKVEVFPLSKKLTFALASRLFTSVQDPEKIHRFGHDFSLIQSGLLAMPLNVPGTTFNRDIKAASRIHNELSPIIKQRRAQLKEMTEEVVRDLISHIIISTGAEDMLMSDHEIADAILGVLLASHETTSTAISFIVYYLADNPQILAQVLREQLEIAKSKGPNGVLNWEDCQKMKCSLNVLNEVLRLQPPAVGGFKQVVNEFTIPKGWKIFWTVHSTMREPKYFPEPEKFDPSRFEGNGIVPFSFVPFGSGPRMCPGSEFARLEILIFLHNLIINFRWEKLMPNEKIVHAPTPIPVNGLPVQFITREI